MSNRPTKAGPACSRCSARGEPGEVGGDVGVGPGAAGQEPDDHHPAALEVVDDRRPDPGGGRGQGVDVLGVPVDAEQPGLGGRHPHDDVEPGVGAHPVVGVGQATGQGRHVTPLPGEDGDAVEQLLEVAHRRARQDSGSPGFQSCLCRAVGGLAVVLHRDLVGRGDALGQVDRHLRPGEPLLGRQVPADPQRDERAAGEDRRVVDELPLEVASLNGFAAGVNGRMKYDRDDGDLDDGDRRHPLPLGARGSTCPA